MLSLCILQIMKNLSYHQKTALGLKWEKSCNCLECVDAPHQKWDVASTYMAPTSWQMVKDYVILLTVEMQLCTRRPVTASIRKYSTLLYLAFARGLVGARERERLTTRAQCPAGPASERKGLANASPWQTMSFAHGHIVVIPGHFKPLENTSII